MNGEHVGQTIKTFRQLRGLAQYELATKIGRSPSWLSLAERGVFKPLDKDLTRIARALNFPVESFTRAIR